jgi:murein L,D-transpeptidase YafK
LKTLDTLLNIAPNFKLAHLVKGDLLMAQAHNLRGFGGVASPASRAAIDDFLQEARVRYNRAQHITDLNRFAEPVWKLDNNTPYVMVVDVRASRLFLYQNAQGGLRHISDYYVTVGKNGSEKHTEGDKRTPIGVYFTGTQLPNKKLPSLYGAAAFPLNYPNEIDRHEGKDGHGIWLHGTPSDTYSRPPNASDGCVVLTNQDLLSLAPILQAGRTPIVIVEHASPETNADSEKSELLRAIEQWRVGLESQKQDMLNDVYAADFFGKSKVRMQMASQTPVTVALSNMNLFRYPNPTKKMVLVDFDQEIQYKTTRKLMHRRQYWVFDNSRWKILYEGAA